MIKFLLGLAAALEALISIIIIAIAAMCMLVGCLVRSIWER